MLVTQRRDPREHRVDFDLFGDEGGKGFAVVGLPVAHLGLLGSSPYTLHLTVKPSGMIDHSIAIVEQFWAGMAWRNNRA